MMKYTICSRPGPPWMMPKSWMSTMFGCPMSLTAFASLKNRAATSWFDENSLCRTLSATFLPMPGCSAR